MKNILELCSVALTDVEDILNIGHDSVRDKLIINGKISNQALETEQFMAKIKALIVCFDKYSRGLNYRVDKLQNPL